MKESQLYIGTRDGSEHFVSFYAKSRLQALKMAKAMDMNSFGRLTDIVVLKTQIPQNEIRF